MMMMLGFVFFSASQEIGLQNVSEMTYFVLRGTENLNSISHCWERDLLPLCHLYERNVQHYCLQYFR